MKIDSKEYDEWLNNPLTKALKQSFERAVTDPENQPSQYGTVTLEMYEALEKQRDTLLAALEKSRAVFDSYVKLHRDKTPPDEEKAARNAFHRGVCDEAIASVKGGAA